MQMFGEDLLDGFEETEDLRGFDAGPFGQTFWGLEFSGSYKLILGIISMYVPLLSFLVVSALI